MSYHASLIADLTCLLDTINPDVQEIYVAGGSYGSVASQMVYGNDWKYKSRIRGLMVLSGFSPLYYHKDAVLDWGNWMAIGPPSRLPWQLGQRLFVAAMGRKLGSLDGARGFIRGTLFDKMGEEERGIMRAWLDGRGEREEDVLERMAEGCVLSVAGDGGWGGFLEVSDVMYEEWGFEPRQGGVVLVVGCEGDGIGGACNAWLGEKYGGEVATVKGGHIGTLFCLKELWERLFELARVRELGVGRGERGEL